MAYVSYMWKYSPAATHTYILKLKKKLDKKKIEKFRNQKKIKFCLDTFWTHYIRPFKDNVNFIVFFLSVLAFIRFLHRVTQ